MLLEPGVGFDPFARSRHTDAELRDVPVARQKRLGRERLNEARVRSWDSARSRCDCPRHPIGWQGMRRAAVTEESEEAPEIPEREQR